MKRWILAAGLASITIPSLAATARVGDRVTIATGIICSTAECLSIFGGIGLPPPKTPAELKYAGGMIMGSTKAVYRVLAIVHLGHRDIAFLESTPPAYLRTGWAYLAELTPVKP